MFADSKFLPITSTHFPQILIKSFSFCCHHKELSSTYKNLTCSTQTLVNLSLNLIFRFLNVGSLVGLQRIFEEMN